MDKLANFYIPPKPEVLTEIESVSSDLSKVAKAVEKEPGLVAKILQLINSPYYGLRGTITSINHAVTFLGYNQIIDTVKGELLKSTLSPELEVQSRNFWRTAQQNAFCAKKISQKLHILKADDCFTLALFHNIGLLLFLEKTPDYLDRLHHTLMFEESGDVTVSAFEQHTYGVSHAELGYHVAKRWGLSDQLCETIRFHHSAQSICFEDSTQCEENDYMAVLKLAEYITAYTSTTTWYDIEKEWELIKQPLIEYLGLSELDFEDIRDEMRDLIIEAQSNEALR